MSLSFSLTNNSKNDYVKAVVAGLSAGVALLFTALSDDKVSGQEVAGIASGVLTAVVAVLGLGSTSILSAKDAEGVALVEKGQGVGQPVEPVDTHWFQPELDDQGPAS